jgi:nitrite reductase (NADH) small subunit
MPTMTELNLGPLSAIPAGDGRNIDVLGQKLAIFHTRAGAVFAVQAECPHRGGPLADGLVGGTTLICPLHAWKFDLATGEALFGECGLKTYSVRVGESGDILRGSKALQTNYASLNVRGSHHILRRDEKPVLRQPRRISNEGHSHPATRLPYRAHARVPYDMGCIFSVLFRMVRSCSPDAHYSR